MNLPKDRRMLISLAESAGWSVEKTNGGHIRLANPENGSVVTTSATPSDYRGIRNFRSELKKAGLTQPNGKAEKQKLTDTTEYFTMPEKEPTRARTQGVVPVVLEVLGKFSRPVEPSEFWPQIYAKLPGYTMEKLSRSLYNMKARGLLKLDNGKWSPEHRANGTSKHTEPVLPTNEDQVALLDALAALEKLKAIVEKYQLVDMTREGMQAAARAELLEKLK